MGFHFLVISKTAQNTFPDSLFALILYPRACLKNHSRKVRRTACRKPFSTGSSTANIKYPLY